MKIIIKGRVFLSQFLSLLGQNQISKAAMRTISPTILTLREAAEVLELEEGLR